MLETWEVFDLENAELEAYRNDITEKLRIGSLDNQLLALLKVLDQEVEERELTRSVLAFAASPPELESPKLLPLPPVFIGSKTPTDGGTSNYTTDSPISLPTPADTPPTSSSIPSYAPDRVFPLNSDPSRIVIKQDITYDCFVAKTKFNTNKPTRRRLRKIEDTGNDTKQTNVQRHASTPSPQSAPIICTIDLLRRRAASVIASKPQQLPSPGKQKGARRASKCAVCVSLVVIIKASQDVSQLIETSGSAVLTLSSVISSLVCSNSVLRRRDLISCCVASSVLVVVIANNDVKLLFDSLSQSCYAASLSVCCLEVLLITQTRIFFNTESENRKKITHSESQRRIDVSTVLSTLTIEACAEAEQQQQQQQQQQQHQKKKQNPPENISIKKPPSDNQIQLKKIKSPQTTSGKVRQQATPSTGWASVYPTFSSLWVPYNNNSGSRKTKVDEQAILEEAGHEALNWAAGILRGFEDDEISEDESQRPNATTTTTKKKKSEVKHSLSELDCELTKLLSDHNTVKCLEASSSTNGYLSQRSRQEVYELISYTFSRTHHWEESLSKSWFSLMWTWRKPRLKTKYILTTQRVNHYPGTSALTRKDWLKRSLQRYRRLPGRAGEYFNIFPETFALPQDCSQFVEVTGVSLNRVKLQQLAGGTKGHTSDSCGTWIIKPVGMSRGRGIEIITHPAAITYGEPIVAQRYISNPLLMYGHKFDLRIYVVVTSFQPLVAYVSRLGFARFASHPFTMDPESFSNKLVHLTNTSVQAGSVPPHFCNAEHNCKWSLDEVAKKLPQLTGVPWSKTWSKIGECLIKCLVAADKTIENQPCRFELLGFDILLDDKSEPWVLEVNASPSLEIDTSLDKEVKSRLIKDCVQLVGPKPFDKFSLLKVVSRRVSELVLSKKTVSVTRNAIPPRQQLNEDLHSILGDEEEQIVEPSVGTNFEILSPSPISDRVHKIIKL